MGWIKVYREEPKFFWKAMKIMAGMAVLTSTVAACNAWMLNGEEALMTLPALKFFLSWLFAFIIQFVGLGIVLDGHY